MTLKSLLLIDEKLFCLEHLFQLQLHLSPHRHTSLSTGWCCLTHREGRKAASRWAVTPHVPDRAEAAQVLSETIKITVTCSRTFSPEWPECCPLCSQQRQATENGSQRSLAFLSIRLCLNWQKVKVSIPACRVHEIVFLKLEPMLYLQNVTIFERVEINCKQSYYMHNRFAPTMKDLEMERDVFSKCPIKGGAGRFMHAESSERSQYMEDWTSEVWSEKTLGTCGGTCVVSSSSPAPEGLHVCIAFTWLRVLCVQKCKHALPFSSSLSKGGCGSCEVE